MLALYSWVSWNYHNDTWAQKHNLSHIMRKRVFGDFPTGKIQTSLLSYRSLPESWTFGYSKYTYHISKQRTTKVLIRLRGCAGWSAPLLFAFDIRYDFAWPSPSYLSRVWLNSVNFILYLSFMVGENLRTYAIFLIGLAEDNPDVT